MNKPMDKYRDGEELNTFEKVLVMMQVTSREELRALAKGDEDLERFAAAIEEVNDDSEIRESYEDYHQANENR